VFARWRQYVPRVIHGSLVPRESASIAQHIDRFSAGLTVVTTWRQTDTQTIPRQVETHVRIARIYALHAMRTKKSDTCVHALVNSTGGIKCTLLLFFQYLVVSLSLLPFKVNKDEYINRDNILSLFQQPIATIVQLNKTST